MLVAFGAVATLSAVGALLATALLVVPAATTRLLSSRIPTWQLATVALAAAEGTLGIWLAVELNAPPGATIAVVAGAAFALVAIATARSRRAWPRRRHDRRSSPLEGLAVGYGGPPVLDDVTFDVRPGERIAVLGPNGGGKTTLFRALLGELRPVARHARDAPAAAPTSRRPSARASTSPSARSTSR